MVWDSMVYCVCIVDILGVFICFVWIEDIGILFDFWFFEVGICNCIVMDLGKMMICVYKYDMIRLIKMIVMND